MALSEEMRAYIREANHRRFEKMTPEEKEAHLQKRREYYHKTKESRPKQIQDKSEYNREYYLKTREEKLRKKREKYHQQKNNTSIKEVDQ